MILEAFIGKREILKILPGFGILETKLKNNSMVL
jgi:hypothetical protein